MVTIDLNLCTGCGLCASDCVAHNLIINEGKAGVKRACIECGHCVAICPKGAVSIPELDMADIEDCRPSSPALSPKDFLHILKARRSIRAYESRPIETSVLEQVLEAGRYTATGANRQSTRFILVQDRLQEFKDLVWNSIGKNLEKGTPEGISAYKRMYQNRQADPANDYLFRNAPAVLFVATQYPLDGGLAAQNLELAALSHGLGMLYDNFLLRAIHMDESISQWLGAEDKPLVACMLLGYPDVSYRRTAPRKKADIVWR